MLTQNVQPLFEHDLEIQYVPTGFWPSNAVHLQGTTLEMVRVN